MWSHWKKRVSLTGCLLPVIAAVSVYAYLCWNFIVQPYNVMWKARYGQVELPQGYSIHGIDISHHQGIINWDKLSESTIGGNPLCFVMMKGTEGCTMMDRRYRTNFREAGSRDFVRGVYHFLNPRRDTGVAQAEFYLSKVHLREGDLPPILDIERTGSLTREEIRREAKAWLDVCEKAYGCPPIIYTYAKFKQQYLDGPEFDRYPYWIAHYYVKNVGDCGPWKFWQHTDCGRLPGIKGQVDLNVYNGSMYDLNKLCIHHDKTDNN